MILPLHFWSIVISLVFLGPAVSSLADDNAIPAVMAADKARGAALLAADTNALKNLLADDLKYTHSSGMVETKQAHIESFANGLRYERFQTSQVSGHVITPEVVVLNGIIDQSKGVGGHWTKYHLLFHGVWRNAGGGWRMVSMQTAAVPVSTK